jgi:dTDP-4-amino-4,6-dideoxygalactose transaminase
VPLIEDAAEALGSEYGGKKCGTFGHFGILSFNGNKIITTSGGGMLVCREAEEAKHALKLATQAREPFPWYQHEEIGFNYRMSNIVAGIGRGQMKVLPLRVEQKRAIHDRYVRNLADLPLTFQQEQEGALSNFGLTSVLLDKDCGVTPAQVLQALKEADIEGRPLWKPMHAQPVFARCDYVTAGQTSVSDDLFARGLCLPSDTKMTMEDVDRVCACIRKVFQ